MIFFRKAVLIIHGFAGGTYDQEKLANFLEKNKKLDVYSFTLPGHEKRSSKIIKYEKWIEESEKQLNKLLEYGYREIYLVGHSMGGVIATYLANKYCCVKKLVLAAPSFSYFISKEIDTFDKLKNTVGALKNNDTDEVLTRFLKLPLLSIREFIKLVDKYKDSYLEIKVPTLFVQGKKDTIVLYKNSLKVYENIKVKKKKLLLLDKVSHDIFREIHEDVYEEIERFLIY